MFSPEWQKWLPGYCFRLQYTRASLVADCRESPAAQETWVLSLDREESLEKGMATHSSILVWRIPWTEETGGLQFMRSQRVRHNWVTNTNTHAQSRDKIIPIHPKYLTAKGYSEKLQWLNPLNTKDREWYSVDGSQASSSWESHPELKSKEANHVTTCMHCHQNFQVRITWLLDNQARRRLSADDLDGFSEGLPNHTLFTALLK